MTWTKMCLIKSSWIYFTIEVNSPYLHFANVFWVSWGILDKDPTFYLDRARPVNTYIPPTFLGKVPSQPCSIPNPKICLQVQKNWWNHFLISEKQFDALTFGNGELVKVQFYVFTSPINLISTFFKGKLQLKVYL